MAICLERGADLHMAQLMPLALTVSCFSKIQIGFTFLLPTHPGSPEIRTVKQVSVCVCVCVSFKIRPFQNQHSGTVLMHAISIALPLLVAELQL